MRLVRFGKATKRTIPAILEGFHDVWEQDGRRGVPDTETIELLNLFHYFCVNLALCGALEPR
ncbi:hypothetical protein CCHR01_12411 [Colletotrichum chrysophilum]|uniref:Uncharacterized protein n=1 Tax=Colletotrichum chrysophilum TaxID=1836956 RepID=A0AAD9EDU2_9PEZI|nr:hypothetical protein CCHR01_12411 [Colletotrichum chrysophilum]